MRTPMARYARLEITAILLIGTVVTAATAYWAGLWALLPAALALALLSFYRDPPRPVPTDPNLVLAPADGKIVEISRTLNAADGRPTLHIMIFLSVFNVHINRSPCAGRVTDLTYRPGEFLNALNPAADARNESNTLTITPAAPLPGPIRVRQIAGVLARRIVCVVEIGDDLAAGERYGMIKLGSRTEVCLPEDAKWDLRVAVGDKVKAGRTVLARWSAPDAT
jgi:phosphatidylserine decarboxylase